MRIRTVSRMTLEQDVYKIIQKTLDMVQNTIRDTFQALNREINLDLDYCEISHQMHENISKRLSNAQETILSEFR